MLEISTISESFWREACAKPGAFAWWYLDLRGGEGTGVVCLWGVGLPFVPGALEERAFALQFVFYERGKAEYYHLATIEDYHSLKSSGAVEFDGGRIQVSRLGETLELAIELRIDSPLNDGAAVSIAARGKAVRCGAGEGAHRWAPQTVVAEGRAGIEFSGRKIELSGSAYFDTNASDVPLREQGMDRWLWGRVSFGDWTFVFYEVFGANSKHILNFTLDSSGERETLGSLEWAEERRAFYGISAPRAATVGTRRGKVRLSSEAIVDDSPFYQRHLIVAECESGERGEGFYEVVVPPRLGLKWQEPLINMRILRHERDRNSVWLPLFRGPRRGRLARLLDLDSTSSREQ